MPSPSPLAAVYVCYCTGGRTSLHAPPASVLRCPACQQPMTEEPPNPPAAS